MVINDRGEVAGNYYDSSGEHGFVASPQGGGARGGGFGFAELLSANARHGGVNDLLPGVPGISGGSPPSANGPGMMDQTPAAGARFASFGGPVSTTTAYSPAVRVPPSRSAISLRASIRSLVPKPSVNFPNVAVVSSRASVARP